VVKGNSFSEIDDPKVEGKGIRTLAFLFAADVGLGKGLYRDGSPLGIIEKSLKHCGLKGVVVPLLKVKASEGTIVLQHIMLSHISQVECSIRSTERVKSVSESGC